MSHKLGICIPYRNRKEHIDRLIPHLTKHLTERGVDHAFYVGHQVDDKLFNRGAMKNIAAHIAFQDGCDYIAWHDVDMLPHNDADYSYPNDYPIHIATKLSKYDYAMGYDQYFGGVVLFTKDQVEKTNGYSNEYWDWGQEDDDLFWRCYFENLTNQEIFEEFENKTVAEFNGNTSFIKIPTNRIVSSSLYRNHTISVLVNSQQQPEKTPIWLVGDKKRKFVEYPILRKEGMWTWGISFNNSRAYSSLYFDVQNNPIYNWAKKSEGEWVRFTVSYDSENGELYVFINDQMVSNNGDILKSEPTKLSERLRIVDSIRPFVLGFCPQSNNYFKGKIGEVKIYNSFFKTYNEIDDEYLVLNYTPQKNTDHELNDVIFSEEKIMVRRNVLPHRIDGSFDCLFHEDEGFVNGSWAKGETTAKNEKRFVTEMQQNKINHKNDGFNKIMDVLTIDNIDDSLYPNTKFINVKMN